MPYQRTLALLAAGLLCIAVSQVWPSGAQSADAPALPAGMQQYLDSVKPAWAGDAELLSAVADGRENWLQLATALDSATWGEAPPGMVNHIVWLIKNAPHLDRLELSAPMLASNVALAMEDAWVGGHSTESDFFRRYILNYRFDDEPVTDWRQALKTRYYQHYSPQQRMDPQKLQGLATAVSANFSIRERGYFGNLADPVSTDNSRAGTKRELALLTAAVFRALGYATRFVRDNASGESWLEVYAGLPVGAGDSGYNPAGWLPVYPTAPQHSGDSAYAATLCGGRTTVVTAGDAFGREQVTARYGPVARVRPVFLRGYEVVSDFKHWSISAFSKGVWVPLDDLEYPSSDKDYPLEGPVPDESGSVWYTLGAPGRYMFTCGVRYPGGVVDVQTRIFDVEPEDNFEHYFELDAPPSLPPAAWVERSISLPEAPSKYIAAQGRYLFLITDDSEPSVRARVQFEQFRSLSSVQYRELQRDSQDPAEAEFISGVLGVGASDALPVAILVIDGRTALYTRGFNLNAADWVLRALGGAM